MARSRMSRTGERISMEEAKRRALEGLAAIDRRSNGMSLAGPAQLAWFIWPGHQMRAQGAGLAAARILKALDVDGLAKHHWRNHGVHESWGWAITSAGRVWLKRNK